jgi:hypothetical protein
LTNLISLVPFTSGNLVLLNLWDVTVQGIAIALAGMSSTLRTLIVSERHRLTDVRASGDHVTFSKFLFVVKKASMLIRLYLLDCPWVRSVLQLSHLNLPTASV